MKITFDKTVKEVIEIELPAFHKNGMIYLKTIDEESSIQVSLFSFETRISVNSELSGSLLSGNWQPISEQEFNEAYDKALRILLSNRPYSKVNVDKLTKLPGLTEHAKNLKALLDVPTLARNLNKAYEEFDLSNTSFDDR